MELKRKMMKHTEAVQATDKLREVLVQTDRGWAFKPGWSDARVAEVLELRERGIVRLRLKVCGKLAEELHRERRRLARAQGLQTPKPVKLPKVEQDTQLDAILSAISDLEKKIDAMSERFEKAWG
jgi:hypothetical protein